MEGIDPRHVEFVLSLVKDGSIFEKFASSFLTPVLGYAFSPVGGIKDKGIDGLEHLFYRQGYEKNLYQISIEKEPLYKAMRSLHKLKENGIEYDSFTFVTNQDFKEKDQFFDEAHHAFGKPIRVFDIKWFSNNINHSPATVIAFRVFIDSYLHDFNQPGKSYVVGDLVDDPRLFVFLRQQVDNKAEMGLPLALADTVIMYALGDTDPEKKLVKSEQQVIDEILAKNLISNPHAFIPLISKRLVVLTRKKDVQFNRSLNGYCLPYETRLKIQEKNLDDALIHDKFKENLESKLKMYLKEVEVSVRDCSILLEGLLNRIFYEQGIEFADFILHGENQDAVEKKLPDIISKAVDESTVINKNKEIVKSALLITIRDIIYKGTDNDKEFLRRLSNTYLMCFLVQCDPKLCMYFSSMATRLNIYVCTSIIIPALSEYYLETFNRRHWNLLKGASETGVNLVINEVILQELMRHFNKINDHFQNDYEGKEHYYEDIKSLFFVEDLMIRAYFYAKQRGKTSNFNDFIGNFLGDNEITSESAEDCLLVFLKENFGIRFITDRSTGIKIDQAKEQKLTAQLTPLKHSPLKAQVDAHLILAIYSLRENGNEKSERGLFGYKTWWLSKDVLTHKTLCELLGKTIVSCYIRPDFLYNYISLAPKKPQVEETFKQLFPTLIGVTISFPLSKDVTSYIHQQIKEHSQKGQAVLKISLPNLAEKLIVDSSLRTRDKVKHYFEDSQ